MSKPLKCRKGCKWFGTKGCPSYKERSFTWCTLWKDKRAKDDANGYTEWFGEKIKV